MPKLELDFIQYSADNTAFRARCQAIEDAIIAMGLAHHAQTGEANLSTINRPSDMNQRAGWRVYKFTDTLQATKPVFIKVFFGSPQSAGALGGGDAFGIFQTFFQVGFTLDGSGNFTGKFSHIRAMSYLSNGSASSDSVALISQANQTLVSGDEDRLAIILGANSNHNASLSCYGGGSTDENVANAIPCKTSLLLIERSKDANGNPTDEGVIFIQAGNHHANAGFNANWMYSHFLTYTNPLSYPHQLINCVYGGEAARTSTLQNLILSPFPFYPMEGGLIKNPPISIIGALSSDYPFQGEAIDVETYGDVKKYRPITAKFPLVIGKQYNNSIPMILWED